MSVSLRAMLVIQSPENDIKCMAMGPGTDTKKFWGEVWLFHDEYPHELLASTDPVFETPEEAKDVVEAVVKQIRAMDLSSQIQQLEEILRAPVTG